MLQEDIKRELMKRIIKRFANISLEFFADDISKDTVRSMVYSIVTEEITEMGINFAKYIEHLEELDDLIERVMGDRK